MSAHGERIQNYFGLKEKDKLRKLLTTVHFLLSASQVIEPKADIGADIGDKIIACYLEIIVNEANNFFKRIKEWREPIIEERTVRKYRRVLGLGIKEDEWDEPKKWEIILDEEEAVIVQGPMGVGKTVLSYQIIKKLIQMRESEKREIIPVRIEGKKLDIPSEEAEYYTLLDLISTEMIERSEIRLELRNAEEKERYRVQLKRKLENSKYEFYLIIDGHDEIIEKKGENNEIGAKTWLTEKIREKDHDNIHVIIIGRKWSIERSFLSLREEGKVAYYQLDEFTEKEVKSYVVAFATNIQRRDDIEERLKLYKEHYSDLYRRPLFLRLLCLKKIKELSEPLDVFNLLAELNQQVLFWITSKYLDRILVNGERILRTYRNLQFIAKINPEKFLELVREEKVKFPECKNMTFIELVNLLSDFMAELTNKLLFEPLGNNASPLPSLTNEVFYSVLNTERFKPITPFVKLLLRDGNYWIIRSSSLEKGLFVDKFFFPVYKMFEYFAAFYAYHSLFREQKPLSILLGNSIYTENILKLLFPLIKDLPNESFQTQSFDFDNICVEVFNKALSSEKDRAFINTFSSVSISIESSALSSILSLFNLLIGDDCLNLSTHSCKIYSIKVLDTNLPANFFQQFFDNVGNLSNLTCLDLSWNNILTLPETIRNLENLEELNLAGTTIVKLPECIGELTKLKKLSLPWTKITSLPESIGKLQNLEELNLVGTKITKLPENIGGLKSLVKLELSWSEITSLPESIVELTNLQILDLYKTPITQLPEKIGKLQQLKELYLSGTKIKSLPDSIGNLKQLEKLYLAGTKISSLPDTITNLQNLKKLYMRGTNLSELPKDIGNMKKLAKLNLSINLFLSELPESIGELKMLEKLNLSYTGIRFLPEDIGNLRKLKTLYLSGTPLTSLPETVGNLKNLEILELTNTKITKLPEEIENIPHLRELRANRSTIEHTPPKIIEALRRKGCIVIEER